MGEAENRLLEYVISIKEDVAAVKQQNKQLVELPVKVGKIEEHLKGMNGKLVKLNTDCPIKHEKVDKRLLNIDLRLAYWGGALTTIFTIITWSINHFGR